MTPEVWGHTSTGDTVHRMRLAKGDLSMDVITLGAAIRDLRLAEHPHPLVLGLNSVADYESHGMYFGAVVGRFANRIAGARFELDGTAYSLNENDNGNTLHGGAGGFSSRVWDIEDCTPTSVTLRLESLDGDMGFSGTLIARCRYELGDDMDVRVTLSAETDAPTVCAMAQHSYFNLEDGGASSIHSHELEINAQAFLQTDARNIPTGAPEPFDGTAFDFRSLRQIEFTEIDHNFCLEQARGPMMQAARLCNPRSGLVVDVSTTEPGLQVYTGDHITPLLIGLDGIVYGPRSGIALETQAWPDAPNRIDFPSADLRPGERLEQVTVYRFQQSAVEAPA
ncbi:MAG: aldose epimerase family protein [Pseudomonadota bacterium]